VTTWEAQFLGGQAQAPKRPQHACTLTIPSATTKTSMCRPFTLANKHLQQAQWRHALIHSQTHVTSFPEYMHFSPQMKFPTMMICRVHEKNRPTLLAPPKNYICPILNNRKCKKRQTRESKGAQRRWYQSTIRTTAPRDGHGCASSAISTAAYESPLPIAPSGIVGRIILNKVCKRCRELRRGCCKACIVPRRRSGTLSTPGCPCLAEGEALPLALLFDGPAGLDA
jgi:hypothetical protein